MTPRHAVTVNGRTSWELKPVPGEGPTHDKLRDMLARLHGKELYAFLLWRLPDGVAFDEVDFDSDPQEYIQCAGGVSGRFTCEIRHLGPEGRAIQQVIGRRQTARLRRHRGDFIEWGERGTPVQQHEVLNLDELVDLFEAYLASGELPSSYATRALPL